MRALSSLFTSQKGAMFGLDARIALGVMGILTGLGGLYGIQHIGSLKAKRFAQEMRDISTAVEAIHQDLKEDLHSSLGTETDQNAFKALFDSSMISNTSLQTRWLGPYTTFESDVHREHGNIRITKMQSDHVSACGSPCYLWLTYAAVPTNWTDDLNEIFDGTSESTPSAEGRFQWDSNGENSKTWFRISRALSN